LLRLLLGALAGRPDDRGGRLGGGFHLGHDALRLGRLPGVGFHGETFIELLGTLQAGGTSHAGSVGSHRVILWKMAENRSRCYNGRPGGGPRGALGEGRSPLQIGCPSVSLSRWRNPPTIAPRDKGDPHGPTDFEPQGDA